ncbi:transmembrane emp24 domain-containing protein 1a [Engraulis encrasicolus]|uniref:transmembrane emp24 domain-containing protein 1a n=1 Tax=Engraulis encrasicolus TaxID=184585 RepID=UPI002FD2293B
MDSLLLRVCSVSFLFSAVATVTLKKNQDVEFTFVLPAGATECFYQTVARQGSLEVEYQVIAGSSLDVGFALISPSGYRLVSEFRRSDGIHSVDPTEAGDYRVCFDNSFSAFSEKMVFARLIMNDPPQTSLGEDDTWESTPEPDSLLEYKLGDIREKIEVVRQHLEQSRHAQAALQAFEARDRYLLDDNLWRVSFWSLSNLLVMLGVTFTQVYTLRRLFDDKRRRT